MAFNLSLAAAVKAARQAATIVQQTANQITPVVNQLATVGTNDNSNTIIRTTGYSNLYHGARPANITPGVNGQMWYHPNGNLYVCVDAYSANAYYNWKRVQLVNL
jgi:hypothetical protein